MLYANLELLERSLGCGVRECRIPSWLGSWEVVVRESRREEAAGLGSGGREAGGAPTNDMRSGVALPQCKIWSPGPPERAGILGLELELGVR